MSFPKNFSHTLKLIPIDSPKKKKVPPKASWPFFEIASIKRAIAPLIIVLNDINDQYRNGYFLIGQNGLFHP